MSVYMSLSEAAWGNGRSAVRANRETQQSFFKRRSRVGYIYVTALLGHHVGHPRIMPRM